MRFAAVLVVLNFFFLSWMYPQSSPLTVKLATFFWYWQDVFHYGVQLAMEATIMLWLASIFWAQRWRTCGCVEYGNKIPWYVRWEKWR